MDKKERVRIFPDNAKEPFSERIKLLLRGRSLHAASRDWDVSVSTLKNYFSRPNSKPRHEVMQKIALSEGVSIEWLMGLSNEKIARGQNNHMMEKTQMSPNEAFTNRYIAEGDDDTILDAAFMNRQPSYFSLLTQLLKMLPDSELKALTKLLTFNGVGVLRLLLDERNLTLLQLDDDEKNRLMALHLAKKGASEGSNDVGSGTTDGNGKKVG